MSTTPLHIPDPRERLAAPVDAGRWQPIDALARAVQSYIREHGLERATADLYASPATLTRIAAGLGVRFSSIALVHERLSTIVGAGYQRRT